MHRLFALVLLAGCHVVVATAVTRPGASQRIQHPEGAIARRPTILLTAAATLRFVEPLDCPTEDVITTTTGTELETRPNLATFVVGVIATAIGGVMTVSGVSDHAATNPLTYAGAGGIALGLPLAVGPWIGLHTEMRGGKDSSPVHKPGPSEPCGERALAAKSATFTVRGIEVHGDIDRDGTFSISPYQLVDAYDTKAIPAWDVNALVETDGGAKTINVVIEAGALASRAGVFLEHADFDAKVEPLRLVPGLTAGTLRASLSSTATGPAMRIVLPLKNDGPGEAWGVRAAVTSSTKAIDGRIIYLGHLAKGAALTRELLIPLTEAAAAAIRGATIDLSIELRDAHGTAPTTAVRFHGAVLGDAPR